MTPDAAVTGAPKILARERDRIEAALGRILDRRVHGVPAALAEPIRYALGAGGKRLRPVLCLTACRALGGNVGDAAAEAAAAIEIVHTYSLVHDDLPCMDDDDLRRGRPTAHRVFGTARATAAGELMIPLAAAALGAAAAGQGLTGPEQASIVRELMVAAGAAGMVGGQWLDLAAEGQPLDRAGLESIHSRKTGALFSGALRIGARLARAEEASVAAMGEAGRWLGLAFQVTDDVLDATGQAHVLGKTAGRDRIHGKATYVELLGVDAARAQAAWAAAQAVRTLHGADIRDPALESLIEFAAGRDR